MPQPPCLSLPCRCLAGALVLAGKVGLAGTLGLALTATSAMADTLPNDWADVEHQAQGQSLYWNAWGGDSNVNAYIDWVGDQLEQRWDIELVHVKLDDTAAAVSRVLAEKSAGNDDRGAIDLIWINGENFAAMKANDLLFGPWAEHLPNFTLTNPSQQAEMTTDFTIPTEGYESPWGKAQLTFYYDSQRVENPPRNLTELLAWAEQNPGRFAYPLVPDFHGSTFLKQALIELSEDPEVLQQPAEEADIETVTAPLWAYLDQLHPWLWRQGQHFPSSGPELKSLMGDGELWLAFTFNPAEPAAAVASYQLPPSTRSYVLDNGTIGNVHFVAIPFNASHKAAAMVAANFLLSPEAQAYKQRLDVWGDPSVLDLDLLSEQQRLALTPADESPARLPAEALSRTLPEPHPSWMEAVEKGWLERYGSH